MIIERKYEYFYNLIKRDPKVKELYEKACAYGWNDDDFIKHVYECNLHNRAFELEFGSGIKNPQIIWDGFAELDEKDPYDNGFTLNDINAIKILNRSYRAMEDWDSEDETPAWIVYAFMHISDGKEYIVKVEKIVE